MVLPCIGSHDHTTLRPSRFTARISAGRCSTTLSAPKRPISVRRPGSFSGLRMSISCSSSSGVERRAAFQADRVLDAAAILDMGVVGLARAVADPDHVARGGVPVARGRIDAGHRLLVAEQQRLVAGVEIGRAQLGMRLRVDADGAHEVERLGDAVGELLVALGLRAVLDEAEHPAMHVLEVGIAAGREGAQQVERRRRLAVGHRAGGADRECAASGVNSMPLTMSPR